VLHGVGQVEAAEERLVAATAAGGPTIRPVAGTWLASVRIHRGDPAAALRALPDALMVEHSHNPLVTPLSHLAAGYASAMLGRPAAALTEFDKHLAASVRLQSDRYAGRSDNMRGWVLRNVGALEAADELNRSAYEVSVRHDAVEPRMHALLDLADGRLRIGDLAGAAGYLRRYHDEFTDHLFAWRNEWRAALLEARLRLAAGELDQAEELGAQVVDLATPHRQARYETLARLVGFQCVRRRGRAVDLDAVGSCVEVLPSVAPLEAWWLTAEAARTFGVAAWMALAHDRVATLAAEAGPHAVTLRAAATRLLS
jgi:tetratricopeptide (TPR) repeat protein